MGLVRAVADSYGRLLSSGRELLSPAAGVIPREATRGGPWSVAGRGLSLVGRSCLFISMRSAAAQAMEHRGPRPSSGGGLGSV